MAFSFPFIFYLYYTINFRKKQISSCINIHFFLNKYSFSEVGIWIRCASQNIYPLYYTINFEILQIFMAAGSGRKSCWKFFLEIFSWKFFLGARPKIFSFPKLGFNLFLSKGRCSFPISLSSLGRLKLSQICEDFYSENLGSEGFIFKRVFYYALIGHLSKILI